jgi:NAD(P)-dependent dehydrogenase (short-subunit alcohol dehydrogenase family)
MRIVVIGATGTIGKEVVKALARKHQIVRVGRHSGDFQVDIASKTSIEQLFPRVGSFDAVICTAGEAKAGRLGNLTDEDFMLSLTNKLMGQVNLVRVGRPYINDNGSFTLTSGVLSREPIPGTAAISMVNAAVEAFARAAALEMERGIRINAVCPVWATETLQALGMDAAEKMPAAKFVPAYRESVEGHDTGAVLDVRDFA